MSSLREQLHLLEMCCVERNIINIIYSDLHNRVQQNMRTLVSLTPLQNVGRKVQAGFMLLRSSAYARCKTRENCVEA
jgi:hypothetical protein